MDIEKLFHGEGGYIFVSHSHLDIKTVREIRNFLEGKGLEPILFYLKSMDDASEDKAELLTSLIHDEIDAREFFLYINSDNAETSTWVQDELNYVSRTAPHKIIRIDLKDGVESMNEKMTELTKKLRVFISCSGYDMELAKKVREEFLRRDFRVYMPVQDMLPGTNYDESIMGEIAKAGCVLVLLTPRSVQSKSVMQEIQYAYNRKAIVISVIVGDVELSLEWQIMLGMMQCFHLKDGCDEQQVKRIVSDIRNCLMGDW